MRFAQRGVALAALGAAALAVAAAGCKDSNSITAPVSSAPAMSIAGTWTGSYQPNSSACSASPASATVQQDGAQITAILTSSTCGMSGSLKGQIVSGQFVGRIEMRGCSGGGVSGTVSSSRLTLAIDDLTRPLVSDQEIVMYGGTVELHR
jgi:hypothetical protein